MFTDKTTEDWKTDAEVLDAMQIKENGGRGVSCVKSIVDFLRRGDIQSAAMVAWNDGDKTRNYPEIHEVCADLREYAEHLLTRKVVYHEDGSMTDLDGKHISAADVAEQTRLANEIIAEIIAEEQAEGELDETR